MSNTYINGLVNVLVPCYNGSRYIKQFFDSFRAQTYQKIELILVNDGSTDNSDELIQAEIIKALQSGFLVNYIVQENRGLGGAINRAIKELRGEFFVWFNIDDILEKNCIEAMVDFLNRHQEYAVVRPNVKLVSEENQDVVLRLINDNNPEADKPDLFENALMEKNFTFGCSMVRTQIFDQVNPKREIYESRQGQNWQLLLPVFYHYKSGYIEQPLYTVIEQFESTSRISGYEKILAQKTEYENILLKTLARMDLPKDKRDLYEKMVHIRYAHIKYRWSIGHTDFANAKQCYRYLKKQKALTKQEHKQYASRFFKIEYWLYLKQLLFSC